MTLRGNDDNSFGDDKERTAKDEEQGEGCQ